ncbi:MAG: SDR family oxidoreductase, partial [Nannocystaceae bacterium]
CVNTICPGLFRTPLGSSILVAKSRLARSSPQQAEQKYVEDTPIGRIGEPEQLGALIAYLCSEPGSHITGQTLLIDGGRVPTLM